MHRSGSRTRRRILAAAVVLATGAGCNAILENEPGRLDRSARESDVEPTTPDPAAEEGEPGTSETEPVSGSASGGDADAAASRDAGRGCAAGMKTCGDLCVSIDEPLYGCASQICGSCLVPNATATCVAGDCAVGACAAGYADCNASPVDGCETDVRTVDACGACGKKCAPVKNATVACVAGACTATCRPGFADCNAKPGDGCERNLLTDKRNCGACGTRCAIGRCDNGTCVWP